MIPPGGLAGSRLRRETTTVKAMMDLFCADHHRTSGALCDECDVLWEYARARLEKCPFQEGKTTCAKCPVHCYRSEMRERIRGVMKYSGPRMLGKHPIMSVLHILDGIRAEPIGQHAKKLMERRRAG